MNKPGTEFAPMLSTWLNEERWKDAGGAAVVTAAEVEASEKLQQEAREDFNARIQAEQERRRKEWGMAS